MSEYAVKAEHLTKTFKLFHEKRETLFEHFSGWLNKKKFYEDLFVLKDITFNINHGETFGIIGKNGMGKTTLLRILAGIYKPNSGKLQIDGIVTPFLSLGVGFHPDLTAKTNVIQYGILLGFSKKKITEMLPQIMEFAELEKFMDTTLKNFSSGMLARLAFSTAIQVDPDILLIDEILSVGDLSFQQKSFEAIMSFKKRGKSIILVTHDLNSVSQYCDRAMLLNKGIIEEIGDPQKVIEKYQKLSQ